jgi:glycosyltransferase involved in cell wall biosynthesis
VTGAVDDIRPYLGKAAVCVVPLRSGSGTRIKIFEAMAMGKAVVSTTMGAEGLPVTHGENIVLADEPADFARQVVQLLRDPQRRAQLGQAARELVEENYGWPSAAAHFEQVMRTVVTHA